VSLGEVFGGLTSASSKLEGVFVRSRFALPWCHSIDHMMQPGGDSIRVTPLRGHWDDHQSEFCTWPMMPSSTTSRISSISQHLRATKKTLQDGTFATKCV